jgi:DNA-binding SARP family transcriptional activator
LEVWLDVEEFEHCVREGKLLESKGQIAVAVTEYDIALNLYRGDFLADTPYESWAVLDRERLRAAYFDALDRLSQIHFYQERYTTCVNLCQLILARDACREDAHCRIMQCYSRLGKKPLALRQYQICVEALRVELGVKPDAETTNLYAHIRRREHV